MTDDDADIGWDISREFLHARQQNKQPFCAHPWRTLRATSDGQTRICCDMIPLPQIGSPTAKEFHSETGLWNHPFMQHIRGTMGTGNETPFCKVCLTTDKRSPRNMQRRLDARAATLAEFERFDADVTRGKYRGSLKDFDGALEDFRLKVGSDTPIAPFRKSRAYYRVVTQKSGFIARKRVLLFGCRDLAFAPFLAESCEHLSLLDFNKQHSTSAKALCEHFGMAVEVLDKTQIGNLPADHFDAIWIAGSRLATSEPATFRNIVGSLAKGGTIHVHGAPSLGKVLEAFLLSKAEEDADLAGMLKNPDDDVDHVKFFTRKGLNKKLRNFGLKFDASFPMKFDKWTLSAEGAPWVQDANIGDAIDYSVSFSAKRRDD